MNHYHFGLGGYKLTQLTNDSPSQMMGYLLDCPDGSVIVIDGGTGAEAPRLRSLLAQRGSRVSLWLFTHAHSDHVTAAAELLEKPDGLVVDRLVYTFPPDSWFATQLDHETVVSRWERLTPTLPHAPAVKGETYHCGGAVIQCLTDPMLVTRQEVDAYNFNVNDTSAVFMFTLPNGVKLLFTGDIGPGMSDLVAEEYGDALHADICQMAHHGQHGASERFYQKVRPTLCLWDAPDWLYENNAGNGYDSGPWATVRVREWMCRLGVIRHVTIAHGENTIE